MPLHDNDHVPRLERTGPPLGDCRRRRGEGGTFSGRGLLRQLLGLCQGKVHGASGGVGGGVVVPVFLPPRFGFLLLQGWGAALQLLLEISRLIEPVLLEGSVYESSLHG